MARLATVTPAGAPHLVPIVFAVVDDTIYSAVDAKPKSTTRLARLANIGAEPRVSVLVDHYDEDWTRLWWARADGIATVLGVDSAQAAAGLAALARRYPAYADDPPPGPVVAVRVLEWSGWSATGAA